MKHLLHIILVFLTITGSSCTHQPSHDKDYEKNKRELTRIYTKLRTHNSIADETCVDTLTKYFDKHGDKHEIYQAHYVKATQLYSKNNKQAAYIEFKNLLLMDTSNEEERDVKRCIYSNLQNLCRDANDTRLAWICWEQAKNSKLYLGEKEYMLLKDKAWIFKDENRLDSCDKYLQLAFEKMKKYPHWDMNKKSELCNQLIYFAFRGKDDLYRERYNLAKTHPYNNNSHIILAFSQLKHGHRDSADIFFRQALNEDPKTAMTACIELAISAKKQNNIDSLFTYFQKYVTAHDSLYNYQRKSYAGHLNLVYENHQQETKNARHRILMLTICLAMAIALLMAIAGWYGAYFYRIRLLKEKENTERANQRTEILESKLREAIEKQTKIQTEEAERRKANLQQNLDEVLMKLKMYAEKGCNEKDSIFTTLITLHSEYAPYFTKAITLKYPKASFTDLLLCTLIVQGLSQKEICVLLDQDRQRVRSSMIRISKNLTGKSVGRMEDFKTLLETYLN